MKANQTRSWYILYRFCTLTWHLSILLQRFDIWNVKNNNTSYKETTHGLRVSANGSERLGFMLNINHTQKQMPGFDVGLLDAGLGIIAGALDLALWISEVIFWCNLPWFFLAGWSKWLFFYDVDVELALEGGGGKREFPLFSEKIPRKFNVEGMIFTIKCNKVFFFRIQRAPQNVTTEC